MVIEIDKGKAPCLFVSLPILGMLLIHCGLLEELKEAGSTGPARWATEVAAVEYGEDAAFGQSDFPNVVLGPPSGGGTQQSSLDVLSLGDGGSITLGFGADHCVLDGQGHDLTVVENVFYIAGDRDNRFIETAKVAVSQDGEQFLEFPSSYDTELDLGDPLRYVGFAGVEPTLEGESPDTVGGDRFDLAQVGLAWARYVRITDTDGDPEDPGDKVGGGYGQAGFDLDAVGAIHLGSGGQCQ